MSKWLNRLDPRRSDAQKRASETNIFSNLHPNYAKMLSTPQRKEWFRKFASATDSVEARQQISEAIAQDVQANRKFLEEEMGVSIPPSVEETTVTWARIPLIMAIVGRELLIPVVYLQRHPSRRQDPDSIEGVIQYADGIKFAVVADGPNALDSAEHEAIHIVDPSRGINQHDSRKQQIVTEMAALVADSLYSPLNLNKYVAVFAQALQADLGIIDASGKIVRFYSAESLAEAGQWLERFLDVVPKTPDAIRKLMQMETIEDLQRFWQDNYEEWGKDQTVTLVPEDYPHPVLLIDTFKDFRIE